jgi:hypothetical protein
VPFAVLASEAVPYSIEGDAAIPVGTVIPGIVLSEEGIVGDRGDVTTGARWEDGWWTLEVARRLDTGNPAGGVGLHVGGRVRPHPDAAHPPHAALGDSAARP